MKTTYSFLVTCPSVTQVIDFYFNKHKPIIDNKMHNFLSQNLYNFKEGAECEVRVKRLIDHEDRNNLINMGVRSIPIWVPFVYRMMLVGNLNDLGEIIFYINPIPFKDSNYFTITFKNTCNNGSYLDFYYLEDAGQNREYYEAILDWKPMADNCIFAFTF